MTAKAPNMLINPITHSDRARTLIDTNNEARTLAITPEGYLITESKLTSVGEDGNLLDIQMTQEQLLTDVLKELKKLNLHMSFLTDINITNQEIN